MLLKELVKECGKSLRITENKKGDFIQASIISTSMREYRLTKTELIEIRDLFSPLFHTEFRQTDDLIIFTYTKVPQVKGVAE